MSTSIRLKQSTAWVALLALASAAASANPSDTDEVQAENVNYEDLNLTTLAGVSVLYSRIERAARLVCGPNNDQSRHGQWKTCYRMAIAAAVTVGLDHGSSGPPAAPEGPVLDGITKPS